MNTAALFASVLAIATLGLASPAAVPTLTRPVITPTPEPNLAARQIANEAPNPFTFIITNKAGVALTTQHVPGVFTHSTEAPLATIVGGVPPEGTMAAGAVHTLMVPIGWSGTWRVNKAGWNFNAAESLLETSYRKQDADIYAGFTVNVSYVDGFTFPMYCYCTSSGNVGLIGCTKNLWQLNTCPANLLIAGQGACRNPLKDNSGENLTPHEFFAPCEKYAYTYPKDDVATSHGKCQTGTITCEVLPNGL